MGHVWTRTSSRLHLSGQSKLSDTLSVHVSFKRTDMDVQPLDPMQKASTCCCRVYGTDSRIHSAQLHVELENPVMVAVVFRR